MRGRQEPLCRLELAGLEARLCGGQRAPGLDRRVRGQRRRPFQEDSSGREPGAVLHAYRTAFQLGRHGLVRLGDGQPAVPRAAVGGELGIARLCQRVVGPTSFAGGRGPVHR